MKQTLSFLFLLLPFLHAAQMPNTEPLRKTVDSLLSVCRTLTNKGQFEAALQTVETAERVALSGFPKESAEYAKCLHEHGRTHMAAKRPDDAEPFLLEAKDIRGRILGRQHVDYGRTLNNLALLYDGKGAYAKAEPLYLEALQIKVDAGRKDSLDYTFPLNNLAHLCVNTGRYTEAEAHYREVLRIRTHLKGRGSDEALNALMGLGNAHLRTARYREAEKLYLEVVRTVQHTPREKNEWYIGCLGNLAHLYTELGDYDKAEWFHEAALLAFSQNYPQGGGYAVELNNTALFYHIVGLSDRAEALFGQALALTETLSGKSSLAYARVLDNLSLLHYALYQFEKADLYSQQAKAVLDKMSVQHTPEYARIIGNRARLCITLGREAEADSLILESLRDLEHTSSAALATVQHNRAFFYDSKNQPDKALEWLEKSLTLKKQIVGEEHQAYLKSLSLLSDVYAKMGNWAAATATASRGDQIRKNLVIRGVSHFSEAEMAAWIGLLSERGDMTASYLSVHQDTALAALLYDNALFSKGFLLNAAQQMRRLALQNSASAQTYEALSSKQFLLSREYAKPVAERLPHVPQWEAEANALEKELARTLPAYAATDRQVMWRDVQAHLRPGEAAIEFVRFQKNFPRPTDSAYYAALLLLPLPAEGSSKAGNDAAPRYIPLCGERQLEHLMLTKNGTRANYLQNLYAASPVGGTSLHQLLWQPIAVFLKEKGVKTVYYAPSGLLHRLNLAAIAPPAASGKRLADQYRLVLMGSTRQLAIPTPTAQNTVRLRDALIYGGIRYDMDSTAIAQANAALSAVAQDTTGGPFGYAARAAEGCSDTARFRYLFSSEKEVRSLNQLLTGQGIFAPTRLGYQASEESFKQIGQRGPSPSLLHIDTHGFFFPDPKRPAQGQAVPPDDAPQFQISEQPMIRSGLILAGADYAWNKKRPLRGMEDGILTAHEVSQMNLSNTQLVVLSACETGLGDILGNEGVYGLQRAFRIAGTQNLLMSLWKVPELETGRLMERFYQNWLERKMPVRDALEGAQAELRKQWPNPYYWAGFVLIGEQ